MQREKQLVLVLGAGASHPYGFPLGRKLVFDVYRDLRSTGPSQTALRQLGFGQDKLNDFADALVNSNQPSIDSFLEARPELQELGKAAIAATLIPLESPKHLKRAQDMRWYEFLFGKLVTQKVGDFPRIDISVITFNYDRSFEVAMHSALMNTYGINDQIASDVFRKIKIVHVYGQLGNLPDSKSGPSRSYSTELSPSIVENAANGIRIISDGREDAPEVQSARELVAKATHIAFLGFGFHSDNVRRLGFPRNKNPQRIFGTCFGMTQTEKHEAAVPFANSYGRMQFFPDDADCLMGLRHLEWNS